MIDVPFAGRAWIDDPDFDLRNHAKSVELHEGAELGDVLRLIERLHVAPYDTSRPLWSATCFGPISGERSALYLHFHHSVSDGTGLMRAHQREPEACEVASAAHPTWLDGLRARGKRARGRAGWAADVVRRGFGDGEFRHGAQRQLRAHSRYLNALARGRHRPLGELTTERRLALARVSVEDFRKAAADRSGRINELFVALSAEIVRRSFEHAGAALPRVRVTMPVDVRSEQDTEFANRFVRGLVELPGEAVLIDDLSPVNSAVARARDVDNAPMGPLVGDLHNLLPSAARRAFARWAATFPDLDASNNRWPRTDLNVGGVPVTEVCAFQSATAVPAGFALFTYEDHCHLTLAAHAGLLPDVEYTRRLFREV
ncbi:MAG: wax ester/triacylglycerol synthase domain-containing protein, partial [Gaiellaceae bacterium]